jgi:hypothetical protein
LSAVRWGRALGRTEACHIGAMSDYQIIPDDDPARFAVKITFASGHSRIQRGFRTESDAKGWLESER